MRWEDSNPNSNLKPSTDNTNGKSSEASVEAPALDRALLLTRQAQRWAQYVLPRPKLGKGYVYRKALESTCFCAEVKARALAVPSKLYGTRGRQKELAALLERRPSFGQRLSVEREEECLVVSCSDLRLGEVQRKHLPWLRPLLGRGVRIHLLKVTGTDRPEKYYGCNVAFAGVAGAIVRLGEQRASRPRRSSSDILLWRDERGFAQANIKHFERHSPSGVE